VWGGEASSYFISCIYLHFQVLAYYLFVPVLQISADQDEIFVEELEFILPAVIQNDFLGMHIEGINTCFGLHMDRLQWHDL